MYSEDEKKFAKGGNLKPEDLTKTKHKVVMDKGEWVMNKKTIQDRMQKFYG